MCSSANVVASTSKRKGGTRSRWVQQQNGRIPRLWTAFAIVQQSCQCYRYHIYLHSRKWVDMCACLLACTFTWASVVLMLGMMWQLSPQYMVKYTIVIIEYIPCNAVMIISHQWSDDPSLQYSYDLYVYSGVELFLIKSVVTVSRTSVRIVVSSPGFSSWTGSISRKKRSVGLSSWLEILTFSSYPTCSEVGYDHTSVSLSVTCVASQMICHAVMLYDAKYSCRCGIDFTRTHHRYSCVQLFHVVVFGT